jgi:hypothetical protein
MKYDYFSISSESRRQWEQLCPPFEYRIISPAQLPGPLPQALTGKYDSVFIMASGSTQDICFWMANGNRVDLKARAIDQMPFGLAFVGSQPIPSGCLIQHGNYSGRTIIPPQEFWDQVARIGVGFCYPIPQLPSGFSGDIGALSPDGNNLKAFNLLVQKLRTQIYIKVP